MALATITISEYSQGKSRTYNIVSADLGLKTATFNAVLRHDQEWSDVETNIITHLAKMAGVHDFDTELEIIQPRAHAFAGRLHEEVPED